MLKLKYYKFNFSGIYKILKKKKNRFFNAILDQKVVVQTYMTLSCMNYLY